MALVYFGELLKGQPLGSNIHAYWTPSDELVVDDGHHSIRITRHEWQQMTGINSLWRRDLMVALEKATGATAEALALVKSFEFCNGGRCPVCGGARSIPKDRPSLHTKIHQLLGHADGCALSRGLQRLSSRVQD